MRRENANPHISTAIANHPGLWEMAVHRHDSFECSVVLDGSGYFQTENGETASLQAGHVVLIDSNVPHRYWTGSSIRFGVLQASDVGQETMELFRAMLRGGSHHLIWLSPLELESYETLFRSWLKAVSQPLREYGQVVSAWVRLLLLTLLQSADRHGKPLPIHSAADYIREHIGSTLSVQKLAQLAGLSESSLRRHFYETYGVSPKQYLQNCRLAEAQWQLRTSSKPIQSIASRIGFMSIHSFSAWFHAITGESPNEWRKRQRSETEGSGET
ncbi:MAG: AraC family transcriptional regulator [Paenibacillus sp.]|jgi:AraC-like DNA-binding protein|nr:AraC family transcriptional regulator [Paenibacillus sp.]